MDVILDVNTDIYPMAVGERYNVALAATINLDGATDEGLYDQVIGSKARSYEKNGQSNKTCLLT